MLEEEGLGAQVMRSIEEELLKFYIGLQRKEVTGHGNKMRSPQNEGLLAERPEVNTDFELHCSSEDPKRKKECGEGG